MHLSSNVPRRHCLKKWLSYYFCKLQCMLVTMYIRNSCKRNDYEGYSVQEHIMLQMYL